MSDMRLIDADKLILHLNDYALQESPSNVESAEDRKFQGKRHVKAAERMIVVFAITPAAW